MCAQSQEAAGRKGRAPYMGGEEKGQEGHLRQSYLLLTGLLRGRVDYPLSFKGEETAAQRG